MENKAGKIPPNLQGVLWSTKIENLNLERDKIYIINQVLSYGTLPMVKWLFQTYPKETITQVFLHHPIKDYFPSRFNLVKNYLLKLENLNLDPKSYVRNLPRNLG